MLKSLNFKVLFFYFFVVSLSFVLEAPQGKHFQFFFLSIYTKLKISFFSQNFLRTI